MGSHVKNHFVAKEFQRIAAELNKTKMIDLHGDKLSYPFILDVTFFRSQAELIFAIWHCEDQIMTDRN